MEVRLANHAGSESLVDGLPLGLEKPKSTPHHPRLLAGVTVIYGERYVKAILCGASGGSTLMQ